MKGMSQKLTPDFAYTLEVVDVDGTTYVLEFAAALTDFASP